MDAKQTLNGRTWPDGWTVQELADYMNSVFEQAGLKTRIRVRPDDEPLPKYAPGSSITDVLKRQARHNSGASSHQEEPGKPD